jgi:spore coat polysaccharide biosynthesis protein SpsF
MKTTAVIQARLGSTRLPGKVLKQLYGRTVLDWVIDRVRSAQRVNEIIVATSISSTDDEIMDFCRGRNVQCLRGSCDDVLGRFAMVGGKCRADWIVRVNSDNPFIDPVYIDRLVKAAADNQQNMDYMSYCSVDGTHVMLTALGFFAEIVSNTCLQKANRLIKEPYLREHVTIGIYQNTNNYRVSLYPLPEIFNRDDLRFTLDTKEDYQFLTTVFSELKEKALAISAEEVIGLAKKRPEWLQTMGQLNLANPK